MENVNLGFNFSLPGFDRMKEHNGGDEANNLPEVADLERQLAPGGAKSRARELDPNMDPKKLRRVLASRQYSQKYRLKQNHYIMELEREVKALQAEVAISAPRIKYVDRQNSLLRVENCSIKQKLNAVSNELLFKEVEYQELRKERDRVKQYYLACYNHQIEVLKSKLPQADDLQLLQKSLNGAGYSQFGQVNQNLNQFAPGGQEPDGNDTDQQSSE